MKKNFFKKLVCLLGLGMAVCTLGACQTVEKNAYVAEQSISGVTIVSDSANPNIRYAQATIAFVNPSIYDVKMFQIGYDMTFDDGRVLTGTQSLPCRLKHGVAAATVLQWRTEDNCKSIKLDSNTFKATEYASIWETYLGWFIAVITLNVIGLLFFGVAMFKKNLTKEMIQENFRDHVANWLFISAAVLIICLFPLIFSSWVSTLILLGGCLAFFLLMVILTAVRLQFAD